MAPVSSVLQPPKARLQALLAGVEAMEARVLQSRPIQVIRVARCGHAECGCAAPDELPVDALVIEMGCRHGVPTVAMPEPEKARSRAEPPKLEKTIGAGISEERQSRVLQRLSLL